MQQSQRTTLLGLVTVTVTVTGTAGVKKSLLGLFSSGRSSAPLTLLLKLLAHSFPAKHGRPNQLGKAVQ